ncbi:MAG: hypothetical protein AAF907_07925, partial [Planctomycetota bacterium]
MSHDEPPSPQRGSQAATGVCRLQRAWRTLSSGGSIRGSGPRRSRFGRMTWAGRSVATSLRSTGSFLRANVWAWPIVGVLTLSVIGLGVRSAIESTMRENLRSQLQTLLRVEVAMLETWFGVQESTAASAAAGTDVRRLTGELLAAADQSAAAPPDDIGEEETAGDDAALFGSDVALPGLPRGFAGQPAHRDLARRLGPVMTAHGYVGYLLADRQRRVLSASYPGLIGRTNVPEYEAFLAAALDGRPTVSPPFPSVAPVNGPGGSKTGRPTMFVAAPVQDENLQVVAALCFRVRPDAEFTDILQLGRIGESGETYAFDAEAQMVSMSRFDDDLKLLGLVPQDEDTSSLLTVQVRDPGGDITEGYRPSVLRAEMPPTRMATAAVASARRGAGGDAADEQPTFDVDGYNDYRGVPVIGAWRWLPDYGLGVATEIDVAEAYRPLTILRRTFWALYGLLVVAAAALLASSFVVARLRREARRAALDAKQVGQYELEEELGRGAMGVVYRGRHALLRRPTAIKM